MPTNLASATEHNLTSAVPPGDCLLFATADWDTPYWTNKQHTADHLAKAGWRVLYVESVGLRAPKLDSGTDWRRIFKRLWRGLQGPRQVQERVWVLSPLVLPFKHHHPWVRKFNQGFLAWTQARFCKRHQFHSPLLWTYHPYVLEQLDLMQHHYRLSLGQLVYHCVDDLSAIPGIDSRSFIDEEKRLLAKAHAVFTTSETLALKCSQYNANVHNFTNVVDAEHFSKAILPGPIPVDLLTIPSPRIGYIGALSDFKVDFQLLHDVAKSNPQWSFVLIGDEREGQRDPTLASMAQLNNVYLLGHKAYATLPDYLRGLDVGLLPSLINDYTRSMFPMKYFEYLAAGLSVVSTPLDFTKISISPELLIAKNSQEFTNAIETATKSKKSKMAIANDVSNQSTWTSRLSAMLEIANRKVTRSGD